MKSLTIVLALAAAAKLTRGDSVSYHGYKVVHVDTHGDPSLLEKISSLHTVDLSHDATNQIDLAVAPEDVAVFEALGIDHDVVHLDFGADLEHEGRLTPYSGKDITCRAGLPNLDWFLSYHPYESHLNFTRDLHLAFPGHSKLFTIGKTYEGRDISGIHLWGAEGPGSRPAVYWHATVHAREWIASMTVEYIAYQLISGYLKEDPEALWLLDSYDFHIIPVINVDGFVYTQTTDRLWRKNRQPPNGNVTCIGTDLNRNWPHLWDTPGGSSTDPCTQFFRGLASGDSPEIQAMVAHADTVAAAHPSGVALFIDWHSFGQLILLPYGGNCSATVEGLDQQIALANETAAAIAAVHGSQYRAGPVCGFFGAAGGGSIDYAFDVLGADLSWAMELRPTNTAGGGFVLPSDQIVPTGEESWVGMKHLLKAM
ncbi:carboxypeptidase B [Plectosphaerella plurivora]|uniref:Carboxypeptidase B n=1 Tax=Plectosphaerella plurivora TaxID=936078 RepID=A0A9P8VJ18_9PEZI|nr:carboxypeptidase B [Plectosphaerella plurivora]